VKATKPVGLAKAGRLDAIFFVAPFQDLPENQQKINPVSFTVF